MGSQPAKKSAPSKAKAPAKKRTPPPGKNAAGEHTGGRPSVDLDDVVDHRKVTTDGVDTLVPVTLLDRIHETIRRGGLIEDAAARCGVSKQTFYEWKRVGTKAATDLLQGRKTAAKLTDEERKCVRFLDTVDRAESERKVFLLAILDREAQGGVELTRTKIATKVDQAGAVLSTTTTTETERTLPDATTARWLLERRWQQEFALRRIELSGPDGAGIEVEVPAVDKLLGELDRIAASQKATAQAMVEQAKRDASTRPAPTP